MKNIKEYINEAKKPDWLNLYEKFLGEKEWLINIFNKLGKKYIDKIANFKDTSEIINIAQNFSASKFKGYYRDNLDHSFMNKEQGLFTKHYSLLSDNDDETIENLKKYFDDSNIEKISVSPQLFSTWCFYLKPNWNEKDWLLKELKPAYASLAVILKEIKENN